MAEVARLVTCSMALRTRAFRIVSINMGGVNVLLWRAGATRRLTIPPADTCRKELSGRLTSAIAGAACRVQSAGVATGNGLCQSIQSYESLWCAHAQFLAEMGLIASTT